MAIGATDLAVCHLRTESVIVRVQHVQHAPPSLQARPPRPPSGCRCRCIACTLAIGATDLRTESSTMVTSNEIGRNEMPRVFIYRKALIF